MTATSINPIIPGFAPDPSVVLVDGTFFLVNSSFHMFPGLPIYASKDLVNWQHIGNAFNRRQQMSLRDSDALIVPDGDKGRPIVAAGGLYAPTIRYHDGIFYIVCTNVVHHRDKGRETEACPNFIISTQDIWSDQWSDPIPFEFEGIDPSLFWDDDGRVYLHGSRAPGPTTTIHQFEIDIKTGQPLSETKKIWDGSGGTWPEGPHVYKRDGWYYLLIAEGGCWEEHMITVARSQNIWGPYESCPNNPILTAFGKPTPIQHTGHAEVFEDGGGRLWAVCLAVRKDSGGRHNLGRETFLTPVHWGPGDWPRIDDIEAIPEGLPSMTKSSLTAMPQKDFLYIRDVVSDNYNIMNEGSKIILTADQVDFTHKNDSPTFVGKRQRQLLGRTEVTMVLGPEAQSGKIKAGLVSYKDEHRYLRIFYDSSKGAVVFEVFNSTKNIHVVSEHAITTAKRLGFQMRYTEEEYRVFYTEQPDETLPDRWKLAGVSDTVDVTNLDFTGPVNGVFAIDDGNALKAEFQYLIVD
ncbi:putative xylosidase/arabinosidase [Mariannaea sp. PMI_226]|nr:putative xylosidase/arabinosidase [Mariannaea sp. PMI_226]